ncbi:hypothetical protein JXB27_02515 [Candidatus Woesearchaeota archaeon]|nr:hypothetical protein [Candidatus Woesearchaeota archaeon]
MSHKPSPQNIPPEKKRGAEKAKGLLEKLGPVLVPTIVGLFSLKWLLNTYIINFNFFWGWLNLLLTILIFADILWNLIAEETNEGEGATHNLRKILFDHPEESIEAAIPFLGIVLRWVLVWPLMLLGTILVPIFGIGVIVHYIIKIMTYILSTGIVLLYHYMLNSFREFRGFIFGFCLLLIVAAQYVAEYSMKIGEIPLLGKVAMPALERATDKGSIFGFELIYIKLILGIAFILSYFLFKQEHEKQDKISIFKKFFTKKEADVTKRLDAVAESVVADSSQEVEKMMMDFGRGTDFPGLEFIIHSLKELKENPENREKVLADLKEHITLPEYKEAQIKLYLAALNLLLKEKIDEHRMAGIEVDEERLRIIMDDLGLRMKTDETEMLGKLKNTDFIRKLLERTFIKGAE